MSKEINKIRYPFVDSIRGLAVFLMIFFHLFYDLNVFKFINISFSKDLFWHYLPYFIVTLFLFSVGLSMSIAYQKEFNFKKFFKRISKIGIAAALISLFTYIFFPNNWIIFGTLHCIFFSSILCSFFLEKKFLALLLGLSIIGFNLLNYKIPFLQIEHSAMDHIEFIPWSGIALLGLYSFVLNFHKIQLPFQKYLKPINFLGKHAFLIYIIHQPILYSIIFIIHFIKGKIS